MLKYSVYVISAIIWVFTLGYALRIPVIKDHYAEIYAPVAARMVTPEGQAIGSGFLLRKEYPEVALITNAHVCQSYDVMIAQFYDRSMGDRFLEVVKIDHKLDLCELAFFNRNPVVYWKAISAANHSSPNSAVVTVGFPRAQRLVVTDGYVGELERVQVSMGIDPETGDCFEGHTEDSVDTIFGSFQVCVNDMVLYIAGMHLSGGVSGSPVINRWGNLVGVLNSGTPDWVGIIPVEHLHKFLENSYE